MHLTDEMHNKTGKKIVKLFLQGQNLRKVMAHLCNNCSSHVADPISDTVVMMLTCPIHLVITEVGIALFKDKPTALFPYSEMDPDQRYFVEEVVQSCLLHCNRISLLPSSLETKDSSGENALPYYHLYHHAVVQMGGGCILYTKKKQNANVAGGSGKKRQKVRGSSSPPEESCTSDKNDESVGQEDILMAMCDCIFASKDYGDTGVLQSICSIILQRVSCMTVLGQEEQRAVHQYINGLSNNVQASPSSSSSL